METERARQLLEAERQRITEEAANLGFQTTDELSTLDPGDTAADLYQEEQHIAGGRCTQIVLPAEGSAGRVRRRPASDDAS